MPMTAPFVYQGESTREISFPLGGIGTGSIGLSGAGRLIEVQRGMTYEQALRRYLTEPLGVDEVIVGKALYERRFTLAQAKVVAS